MKLATAEIKNLVSQYFPYLEEKELNAFINITEYLIFKPKEIIFKSEKTDKCIFLILKGAARAYIINEDGDELNNHIRSEGLLMGDPRVFGNETQILDVEAIDNIHILKFCIDELETLSFQNQQIMVFYLNMLKEIILTLSHRVNTFVTMSSKERYLDLMEWNPSYLKSTFDKQIASFLGIKPLTLHRIKKSNQNNIK